MPSGYWWSENWGTRRQFYDFYKRTLDWHIRRLAVLDACGHRCERCGAEGSLQMPLEVDHLNYARLGAELPTDLQVLCRACHDQRPMGRRSAEARKVRNDHA